MPSFDLNSYVGEFSRALKAKYGDEFVAGRQAIEHRYKLIRSGNRDLTPDDVLAIFDPSLPYASDWTKPDAVQLASPLGYKNASVAAMVRRLKGRADTTAAIEELLDSLRDLGLTALILHHVYPDVIGVSRRTTFPELLKLLPEGTIPSGITKRKLDWAWGRRNTVMHAGEEITSPSQSRRDATSILRVVSEFVQHSDFMLRRP